MGKELEKRLKEYAQRRGGKSSASRFQNPAIRHLSPEVKESMARRLAETLLSGKSPLPASLRTKLDKVCEGVDDDRKIALAWKKVSIQAANQADASENDEVARRDPDLISMAHDWMDSYFGDREDWRESLKRQNIDINRLDV